MIPPLSFRQAIAQRKAMNEYNDNSKYAKYEANFGSEEINHG